MNTVDPEIIWNKLNICYKYCMDSFPEKSVFGAFVYGDVNYNMAYESKDVHIEMIYIPNPIEISYSLDPINKTLICHGITLKIKDIRYLYNAISNGFLELTEGVYTDYYIVNPIYESIYNILFKPNREKITQATKQLRMAHAAQLGIAAVATFRSTLSPYSMYTAHRWKEFCEKYEKDYPYDVCLDYKAFVLEEDAYNYKYNFDYIPAEEKAKFIDDVEKVLLRFANSTLKDNPDDFPADALKSAIAAIFRRSITGSRLDALLNNLTDSELSALRLLFKESGVQGDVSMSGLGKHTPYSRQVYTSLINKLTTEHLILTENHGAKGTGITFIDNDLIKYLQDYEENEKEEW